MSEHMNAERFAREFLEKQLRVPLRKQKLTIGFRKDGWPQVHEFDLVSPGNENSRIVGEVKDVEWDPQKVKFCYIITDVFYLMVVKAKRKLLILTRKEAYDSFVQETDGLLPPDIEVVHLPVTGKKP